MMKHVLRGTLAAAALLSTTGIANADVVADLQITGLGGAFGVGTSYSVVGGSLGNSSPASPTVTNTWLLTGTVTPDCSYYGGNGGTAHTIDFGTLGVNTGNGENVADAFDLRAPIAATINSATAGCNTNNTVKITKNADGLVNTAGVGYDNGEFQKNIPYSVAATFKATTNTGAGQAGSTQTLTAASNAASATWAGGAWRSNLNLVIAAPVPSKALVAGTYSDTLTLELKVM